MRVLDSYRNLKQNRRKVGILKLAFWIVFMLTFFIIYKLSAKTYTPSVIVDEKESVVYDVLYLKSFKFEYKINDTKYDGIFLNDKVKLENEDNNFLVKDSMVYYEKMNHELEDIFYLYPTNLQELINTSSLEATTNFKDESIEYKLLNEENDINLSIKVKDNDLVHVYLEYNDNIINIDYYEINSDDLSIDDDLYINVIDSGDE